MQTTDPFYPTLVERVLDYLKPYFQADSEDDDCETCGGTGELARPYNPTEGAECPDCRGRGKRR